MSKPSDHLNKKIAQRKITSWLITDAFLTLTKYRKILFLHLQEPTFGIYCIHNKMDMMSIITLAYHYMVQVSK